MAGTTAATGAHMGVATAGAGAGAPEKCTLNDTSGPSGLPKPSKEPECKGNRSVANTGMQSKSKAFGDKFVTDGEEAPETSSQKSEQWLRETRLRMASSGMSPAKSSAWWDLPMSSGAPRGARSVVHRSCGCKAAMSRAPAKTHSRTTSRCSAPTAIACGCAACMEGAAGTAAARSVEDCTSTGGATCLTKPPPTVAEPTEAYAAAPPGTIGAAGCCACSIGGTAAATCAAMAADDAV
mmetsp:Transcript_108545/g.346458  ORF Transcript_108545/g.346458 Transcript_108545/m.346458 type:complete len:238 (-) Transcript_108545:544-1257(-)